MLDNELLDRLAAQAQGRDVDVGAHDDDPDGGGDDPVDDDVDVEHYRDDEMVDIDDSDHYEGVDEEGRPSSPPEGEYVET